MIKPAQIGSISHGTLVPFEVLNALLSELEWQILHNGEYFSLPENFPSRDRLNAIVGFATDCFNEGGYDIDPEKDEDAQEAIESIGEVLTEYFAPPYCYFGTNEGDGSDFGYWPSLESIEELPVVQDSDEAKTLGEDCRYVNDHGNVTVFGGDGSIVLDFV